MLSNIITGKKKTPLALMLYGVEGIGKTTFAMDAENPINLGAEPNDEIEGARFPVCNNIKEFNTNIDLLLNEKHDYKTLVVDTLDSVEHLLHADIAGDKTMATVFGGYGKGYEEANKRWLKIRSKFDLLRKKGMSIVLCAHATKVKFEDPLTPDVSYDTYQPKLHVSGKGEGATPIFTEWVSTVLFANYRVASTKSDETGKTYVAGLGERRIFTEKRPGYFAKNRYGFPHEIPMEYKVFNGYINDYFKSGKDDIDIIYQDITELLTKVKDADLVSKIVNSVENAKRDISELKRIKSKLITMGV